ncbi:MAG: CDP-glucose 4,6-dehydratase [Phycisphaerae bacterium]|nr:CDP-glucose 4,6-dehydratase [Phycisphaerae bacterium]
MRQPFDGTYEAKTVFITGHTGFKGGWLTLWLESMGAKVVGYSLDPPTTPSLYEAADVGGSIEDIRGDVRDFESLSAAITKHRPHFVFHLAAQAIVRQSYSDPLETYSTNLMGTVNVLEAVRRVPGRCCVVNVTSDKCYDNRGWVHAYRENDAMGGHAPYNSSKGCAELAALAYRRSFFPPERFDEHHKALVSARAGNVIGGGDWAVDRLVPDCLRCIAAGKTVPIRNPNSVRPWQHVLDPLAGYLCLGAKLSETPARIDYGWNFGPQASDNLTVKQVVEGLLGQMGTGQWQDVSDQYARDRRHEDQVLRLDCTKAISELGWQPVWPIKQALTATAQWYSGFYQNADFDARACCLDQVEQYVGLARDSNVAWALAAKNLECPQAVE